MKPLLLFVLTATLLANLFAQGVTPGILLKPPADSWPAYHGDYSGRRHSALTQITPDNVHNLGLSWAFQTGVSGLKCVPLLVDGVLYVTLPDNVWAVDARSGHQIWHYEYPQNKGFHIGREAFPCMANGSTLCHAGRTPDLPQREGRYGSLGRGDRRFRQRLLEHHVAADRGQSCDGRGFGRFRQSHGLSQIRGSRNGQDSMALGQHAACRYADATTGGMTWMTGTYDPELNLIYQGTGNPTPVLTAKNRPGDDLYTCSIVALNPDTGKMAWHFQPSPHDTHDWDAIEIPVLVDADFHGMPRRMLMQTSRNGYFFVLDRVTGENLLTAPFGPTNWATGIDKRGRPIPNPDKEPAPDGRLIAPDEGGLTNYRSPSFDPKTGLFIVDAHPSYGIYFAKPADGSFGWAGADYGVWGKGVLEAIDYQTGKIRWSHELGPNGAGAGVLTTDSGLLFTGDAQGSVLALRTSDGTTLWHAGAGGSMQSSPITYELDGRQYVVTSAGGVLFAWALPEK